MTHRFGRLQKKYSRAARTPSRLKAGPWVHGSGCKKSGDCPKDNTCIAGECCHIDDVLCGIEAHISAGGAGPTPTNVPEDWGKCYDLCQQTSNPDLCVDVNCEKHLPLATGSTKAGRRGKRRRLRAKSRRRSRRARRR